MNNQTLAIPKILIGKICGQLRWIEELVDGDDYTDRETYSAEEILEMIWDMEEEIMGKEV